MSILRLLDLYNPKPYVRVTINIRVSCAGIDNIWIFGVDGKGTDGKVISLSKTGIQFLPPFIVLKIPPFENHNIYNVRVRRIFCNGTDSALILVGPSKTISD